MRSARSGGRSGAGRNRSRSASRATRRRASDEPGWLGHGGCWLQAHAGRAPRRCPQCVWLPRFPRSASTRPPDARGASDSGRRSRRPRSTPRLPRRSSGGCSPCRYPRARSPSRDHSTPRLVACRRGHTRVTSRTSRNSFEGRASRSQWLAPFGWGVCSMRTRARDGTSRRATCMPSRGLVLALLSASSRSSYTETLRQERSDTPAGG